MAPIMLSLQETLLGCSSEMPGNIYSSILFYELLEWMMVWIKLDNRFNSVFTQDMHEHPQLYKALDH